MAKAFWGYHVMIDCSGLQCPIDKLNNVDYIKDFVKEMLQETDMKAWGEPMIARLTEEDGVFPESLSGYTVCQLLHTSNMTMHLCDLTGQLFFDLFSCKSFCNQKVIKVIDKFFSPTTSRVNFLTREP